MNWLTLAVVGFLILSAWDGHRKGFLKKSVKIVSIGLTLFLTSAVSSYMMVFLKEKTGLNQVVQHRIASSELDILEALQLIGLDHMLGEYLTDLILQVLAFLITFLLVSVLIQGVVFSLGIVAKLPVLRGLNKTAGLFLGLAEGVLVVWIFFFAVTVFVGTRTGGRLLWMIADSDLLSWIYRKNLLLLLL